MMKRNKWIKITLITLGLLLALSSITTGSLTINQTDNAKNHLKISNSDSDSIVNGYFESGTSDGWDLKFLKAGEANIYEVSSDNPHSGTYSYYMYAEAYNPDSRGCYIEIGQNITLNAISTFNLTGYVYVDQCSSANTYRSWVGVYIAFYNSNQNELGRVYYQFASNHQYDEFDHEINLYNQSDTWLKFDRNIAQDFINEIGGDIGAVTQIELVFYLHASDGNQAGNRGYCEAYFDDWSLERHPVSIVNGDFESGTADSWDLKLLDDSVEYYYEVRDTKPYTGSFSYYLYGKAVNTIGGPRGCKIEIGQNITLSSTIDFNLTGNVYVDQCSSVHYASWAGVYVAFYNSTQDELGRVYYQFAEYNKPWDFDHEIKLYNQLDTWLEFDRNIAQDFINEIGSELSEVIQIELVFHIIASDGTQAGNTGYCEAYFDDWIIEPRFEEKGPIYIDDNADFADLGFLGNGILGDPYLIENYTIISSETILIEIRDTTAHFRIKNNILNGLKRNYHGIYLHNVVNGTIINNTIHSCLRGVTADHFSLSNTITRNFISNNTWDGISIQGATDLNNITHNTVFNSGGNGIWLESAFNNTLLNNTISNSDYDGIGLVASDYNDIFNNTISSSARYGISLTVGSAWNLIKWNDFINNNGQTSQALDNVSVSTTTFNYNYWGDWTSPDSEPNGIVDNPYLIDGDANNNDPYPLTSPNNPIADHSLSILTVLYPNGGETLSGTIEIEWSAASDTWGHPITYIVYYSADGGTTWNELDSGLTTTSYDWDTTTVADGTNYLVKVNATCSEVLWKDDTSDVPFTIDNPYPPTVTVTYPNGGETLSGTVMITWSASDIDGDPLTFNLSYWDGANWILIEASLTATSYDWDTTTVPDGSTYQIQVIASDGTLTGEDTSNNSFTIDNPEPTTTTTATTTSEPGAAPGWTFPIFLLAVFTVLVVKRGIKRKSH